MSEKNFRTKKGLDVNGDDISRYNGRFALKVPSGNDVDAGASYDPNKQKPSSTTASQNIKLEAGMIRYNTDKQIHEQSIDDGFGGVVWKNSATLDYKSETFTLTEGQMYVDLSFEVDAALRNYAIEYDGVSQDESLWHPVDGSNNVMSTGKSTRIKFPVGAELDGDRLQVASYYIDAIGGLDPLTQSIMERVRRVKTIADLRAISFDQSVENQAVMVLGKDTIGDGLGGPLRYHVSGASAGTYTDDGFSVIVPTGGDGSAAWIILPPKSVTGSRSGGTALANLLVALESIGIITNDTSA